MASTNVTGARGFTLVTKFDKDFDLFKESIYQITNTKISEYERLKYEQQYMKVLGKIREHKKDMEKEIASKDKGEKYELEKDLDMLCDLLHLDDPRKETYITMEHLQKLGWTQMEVIISYTTDNVPEKEMYMPVKGTRKITQCDIDELNEMLEKYEINTKYRIAHFLGQVYQETGEGGIIIERYNGESIVEHFSRYENKYGNNNRGDGAKYRGAGLLQLTFKDNYVAYSKYVGDEKIIKDGAVYLAQNYAIDSGGWFWNYRSLNELADDTIKSNEDDVVERITRVINGGTTGLENRKKYYHQFMDVLNS